MSDRTDFRVLADFVAAVFRALPRRPYLLDARILQDAIAHALIGRN